MNVNDTVRRCLWNYPTLYPSRLQALEHLLCVIGNGYEWDGGEIVYCWPDDPHLNSKGYRKDIFQAEHPRPKSDIYRMRDWMGFRNYDHIDDAELRAQLIDMPYRLAREDNDKVRYNHQHIDRLTIEPGEIEHIYPMCQYSLIMCVPDDVKADWLDACFEMAACVMTFVPKETRFYDPVRERENTKNNRALIQQVMPRLEQLRLDLITRHVSGL